MSRKNKNRLERSKSWDDVDTTGVLDHILNLQAMNGNPSPTSLHSSGIDQPQADTDFLIDQSEISGDRLLQVVCANTDLLQKIHLQLQGLSEGMVAHLNFPHPNDQPAAADGDLLRQQIVVLQSKVTELERQNRDLSAQVASAHARCAVVSPEVIYETMSWEERKQLILKQMESEDFDTDEFVTAVSSDLNVAPQISDNPVKFVQQLTDELAGREKELGELRHLLEQQSQTRQSGVSIGAAGIAGMIDSDELVQEERRRLQKLQSEWEDKFRQGEIEASLERAKLSRERRELAAKQMELERELEKVRLNAQQASEKGKPRKWLSELGLSSS